MFKKHLPKDRISEWIVDVISSCWQLDKLNVTEWFAKAHKHTLNTCYMRATIYYATADKRKYKTCFHLLDLPVLLVKHEVNHGLFSNNRGDQQQLRRTAWGSAWFTTEWTEQTRRRQVRLLEIRVVRKGLTSEVEYELDLKRWVAVNWKKRIEKKR